MVTTQHFLATGVGEKILNKGGNAYDASIAIAFTLAVVLPRAGNIGGGGFMLYWDNSNSQLYAIDGIYFKNKFNKNLILYYMREMTSLNTKDIRNAMKRYKIIYNVLKQESI